MDGFDAAAAAAASPSQQSLPQAPPPAVLLYGGGTAPPIPPTKPARVRAMLAEARRLLLEAQQPKAALEVRPFVWQKIAVRSFST